MESWGRGIELIRSACHAAGEPEPIFRWDNGLWVEFPFPVTSTDNVEQKLAGGWGEKWGEKWGETLSRTRREIVEAMIRNPRISSVQLATEVGISSTAIEKNLKFLKENGFIARIGPAKGGHWEVLK
jgi:ATP-dependent DNA helicase RecG